MVKDEHADVVEYLPYGLSDSKDRRPSTIILTDSFALLLAALKKDAKVEPGQKVYIGEEKRPEIHHIVSKVDPSKLTERGAQMLDEIITKRISVEAQKFVNVINTLGPVNIRLHAMELIPGIGKKMMEKLLEERKKKPFTDFEDINTRLHLTMTIQNSIKERIKEELSGKDKYRIFVGAVV